ncbi:peptidyl-prolyl cis-trans isomerase FKBP20-2, chloroplastic isoform X2 [Fagus crenata]
MMLTSSAPSFISKSPFPYRIVSECTMLGTLLSQKKQVTRSCSILNLKGERQGGNISHVDEKLRRRLLFVLVTTALFPTQSSSGKTKNKSPFDEKRLLEQNKRIQKENNAPEDFPTFVREGFQVNVVTPENCTKRDSGPMYRDIEVTFHYVGYNESGRHIDSTYLQGSPAKIRLGNNALVPEVYAGFEEGIRDLGGKEE